MVLAAVKLIGDTLAFASDQMKEDKEVVLTAVEQNGMALKYASHELNDDKDVVMIALTNYVFGHALQ